MNASLLSPPKFDIQGLVRAIAYNVSRDSFLPALTPAQWEMLSGYLQPFTLMPGQLLIEQNAIDRTLYLVETGALTVHYEDGQGRIRLAEVGPGSVVGEGAFFTRQPRSATVQSNGVTKVWCLTPIRFKELSSREPGVALEWAMALGSLVSRRLVNTLKRPAVT